MGQEPHASMQTSKMYKAQEGPRYLQKPGNGQLKEAGAKMDRFSKREHIKGKIPKRLCEEEGGIRQQTSQHIPWETASPASCSKAKLRTLRFGTSLQLVAFPNQSVHTICLIFLIMVSHLPSSCLLRQPTTQTPVSQVSAVWVHIQA